MPIISFETTIPARVLLAFNAKNARYPFPEGIAVRIHNKSRAEVSYRGIPKAWIAFDRSECTHRPWMVQVIGQKKLRFKSLNSILRGGWWNTVYGPREPMSSAPPEL